MEVKCSGELNTWKCDYMNEQWINWTSYDREAIAESEEDNGKNDK